MAFYSFKGGVGRTMTLANVAWRLADRHGLRVVVVDFDLDAPALHGWFGITEDVATTRPGVLDFLNDWMASVDQVSDSIPDARASLVPVKAEGFAPRNGELSVMLAGRLDDQYDGRLAQLDLGRILQDAAGPVAIDTLRLQLLECADVILVDCHAGLSDSARICTTLLADAVVLLTTPAAQSLVGAERIARALATTDENRAGRPPPRVWFTVCQLPIASESQITESWLDERAAWFAECAQQGLWSLDDHARGLRSHTVPYQPRWAFGEQLLYDDPGTRTTDPLMAAYDALASLIDEWGRDPHADPSAEDGTTPLARVEAFRKRADQALRRSDIPGASRHLHVLAATLAAHGRVGDALESALCAAGVEAARGHHEAHAARLLLAASMLRAQRRFGRAVETLEFVLGMGSSIAALQAVEAATLLEQVYRDQSRFDDARRAAENATRLLESAHEPYAQSRQRRARGVVSGVALLQRSLFSQAWTTLEKELRAAMESRDVLGEAAALLAIGHLRFRQLRFDKAAGLARSAAGILLKAGHYGDHAQALVLTARAERRLGHLDAAREAAEGAVLVSRKCGGRFAESAAVLEVGHCVLKAARLEEAGGQFMVALRLAAESGNREVEVMALRGIGRVRAREQRLGETRAVLEQTLLLAREIGHSELEGVLLRDLGELHWALRNPSLATTTFQESAELLGQIQSYVEELASLAMLRTVHETQRVDDVTTQIRTRELRQILTPEDVDLSAEPYTVYL